MRHTWKTSPDGMKHPCSVSDGMTTSYCDLIGGLEETARAYADSYDFNGKTGQVVCRIIYMPTGKTADFSFAPEGRFEWKTTSSYISY